MVPVETATILAAVAIGISVLTLGWTIFWSVYTHRRTTRAGLSVTNAFSVPVYGTNLDHLGRAAVGITVANTGAVTVAVTGVQLRIKGKKDMTIAPTRWVVQDPRPLPITLEPGGYWNGLVPARDIVKDLDKLYGRRPTWRLKAFVHTPSTRKHEASKWVTLDAGAVEVFERP